MDLLLPESVRGAGGFAAAIELAVALAETATTPLAPNQAALDALEGLRQASVVASLDPANAEVYQTCQAARVTLASCYRSA